MLPVLELPPTKPPTPVAELVALTIPVLELLLMLPWFKPTNPPMLVALAEAVVPPTSATLEMLAAEVVEANMPTEVRLPEGFTFKPVMLCPKPWKVPLKPVPL